MYKLAYLEQNLFEREDVLPPCEYFKPTFQVDLSINADALIMLAFGKEKNSFILHITALDLP